jgi:hypothetical protein
MPEQWPRMAATIFQTDSGLSMHACTIYSSQSLISYPLIQSERPRWPRFQVLSLIPHTSSRFSQSVYRIALPPIRGTISPSSPQVYRLTPSKMSAVFPQQPSQAWECRCAGWQGYYPGHREQRAASPKSFRNFLLKRSEPFRICARGEQAVTIKATHPSRKRLALSLIVRPLHD